MPIIQVIVILVVIGVLLYVVNTYVPMAESIKKILNIAVIVLTCICGWPSKHGQGFGRDGRYFNHHSIDHGSHQ